MYREQALVLEEERKLIDSPRTLVVWCSIYVMMEVLISLIFVSYYQFGFLVVLFERQGLLLGL